MKTTPITGQSTVAIDIRLTAEEVLAITILVRRLKEKQPAEAAHRLVNIHDIGYNEALRLIDTKDPKYTSLYLSAEDRATIILDRMISNPTNYEDVLNTLTGATFDQANLFNPNPNHSCPTTVGKIDLSPKAQTQEELTQEDIF